MLLLNSLLLAIGGFLGSISRFYCSIQIKKKILATLLVNVLGSIILAILLKLTLLLNIADGLWLLLGIGFSGAFTTFSTFSFESLQLIIEKKWLLAISYITSSFTLTILIVFIILQY